MDFAADDPFARVALKLREHYGFDIGESTVQRIALGYARAIFESGRDEVDFPKEVGQHKKIVAQIDGGMIPVTAPDANQTDKRKGKTLSWREAKISLAHAKGSRTPVRACPCESANRFSYLVPSSIQEASPRASL